MNKRGFSLIEVMVALVILAIGLLAIAGMLITSVRGNFSSNSLTQASYVAQERLEFLRGLGINDAALGPGSYSEGPTTISGTTFVRAYTVAQEMIPNGSLKRITYTVSWNDGVNHFVTFTTKRAQ